MKNIPITIHQLPCAALITDSTGKILDVNRKTEELVGFSSNDLIGKPISSLESKETKSEARNIITKIINGSSSKSEVEVITKLNEKLTLELRTSLMKEEKEMFVLFEITNVTHYKRVKDELNEQRRFQKTLIHNLPGMVYRCQNDKNWTMEYISHHCIELTGYKPEDFIGNNKIAFNDIIHPNHRQRIWDKWQSILADHEVFTDEYPIITANGKQKWVWEQGVGVYNSNLELIALEGIIVDITEQKQTRETLEFQAGLLDQIGDLITATDLEGRIIYVNEAETKLTGKTRDELIGQKVKIYGEDKFKGATQEEILKTTLEKGEWRGEVVNYNKQGKPVTLDCRTWVVYNENQEPIALCGISTDISERKTTENALRQSEEMFRMLVENAFDGIYLMRNRRYEYANQRFIDITGYSFEELTDDNFDFNMLLTPKSKQLVEQRYQQRLEGKPISNQYEIQIKTPKGITREVEVSTVSLGSQGNVIVLGIMRDITERKQTQLIIQENEEKLRQQNQEYLAINEELIESNKRIKEINTELRSAKESAEESEKLMSAFLANMSHEIRTPMNGIMGFSQLIQNPNLSHNERNDFISIIQNSSNQLLSIINDLIDISKIQSNLIKINPAPVNLNDLLHEQFLLFKPKADSLGLTFTFSSGLPDNDSIIEIDADRLRQVITNLLGNAFKFTKSGFVKFGYVPKATYLQFFVEDSGIGIPPEMRQIIFNIFRQVETDLSRQTGGTGLGLSISKALINKMGGEIDVESSPSNGSKFIFTVPYNVSTEKKYITSEFISIEARTGKKRILIAEDNEINYLYFKQLLNQLDAEFSWATNGLEAVEMVKNNPSSFDLVLMDIKMPVMDGYEATRKMKKFRNDLPIIAQTAYAFASDREKALEAGCDDYISKPINRDRLVELLMKYLKR